MMQPKTIKELMEVLATAPSRQVLSWSGGAMTAGALSEAVRARCEWLAFNGVGTGDRVAIWMPKGPRAVEILLACMLAGAIAVAVDPTSPPERVANILVTIQPSLLVSDAERLGRLAAIRETAEAEWPVRIEAALDHLPIGPTGPEQLTNPPVTANDAAIILMTSGSTGVPKGVVLSHGNIDAFSDWAISTFAITSEDRFANISPLHFDLSLLDVLTALRIGAAVRLISERDSLFPMDLANVLEETDPTILYTVPTTLQRLANQDLLGQKALPGLRWVLYAGEVFPAPALRSLMTALPRPSYANLYGPTETNVIASKIYGSPPENEADANIGRACDHSSLSLRTEAGREVPLGEIGEICVQGPTVMQGYWGKPELTGLRYFVDLPGVFRTGDFGFWGKDGDLRFVGRRDRQIKLSGYRIDLGEIEACAIRTGLVVAAAAVLADETTICLHIIPALGETFEDTVLRRELSRSLPRYAVPARVVGHSVFPVTASGKVDYVALTTSSHNKTKTGSII